MPKRKRSNNNSNNNQLINNTNVQKNKNQNENSLSKSYKVNRTQNVKVMSITKEDKEQRTHDDVWSKSKKKRMRSKKYRMKSTIDASDGQVDADAQINDIDSIKIQHKPQNEEKSNYANASKQDDDVPEQEGKDKNELSFTDSKRPISALQQVFRTRLAGSRFRELNEELYTTSSSHAYQRFRENPELFEQYHEGFRAQVKSWPINPVDLIFNWIINLQRTQKNDRKLVIADFGCGDAKLAEKLLGVQLHKGATGQGNKKKNKTDNKSTTSKKDLKIDNCPFKVHSFDLVSNGNKLITPCDMAKVPLNDAVVDVGVFSLALMGTNIADFIREAHRVLTPDGILKIAEVRSRFETKMSDLNGNNEDGNKALKKSHHHAKKVSTQSRNGTDDALLKEFLMVMQDLGFKCTKTDKTNILFMMLEFEKNGHTPSPDATFTAKPCIYKRR